MPEPRKVIDSNKVRRNSPHPDIQLFRSVEQEGDNQVITDLDGGVEFRINGRPPQENRATADRGVDEEQRREVQETLQDIERRTIQRRQEQAAQERRPNQWLVAFTRNNRIIEYDRSHHRRTELTFPPSSRRNYYQAGDFILIGEHSRRLMQQVFPELRRIGNDDYSFSDMLSDYLGVSDRDVKIGYKIMSIRTSNHRTGEGRVQLRAHLFIDDNTVFAFPNKPDLNWNRRRLHQAFDSSRSLGTLLSAVNTTGALMEFAVDLTLGGGLRAIGTRLARRLGRRFLVRAARGLRRAVLRLILSKVRQIITQFLSALARAVATKVMQHRQQNEMRRQLDFEEVDIDWPQVITEAATAAALNIVGRELTNMSDRRFRDILNSPSDEIRRTYSRLRISTPNELISHTIARKVTEISIASVQSIVDVFRKSLVNFTFDERNQNTLAQTLEREAHNRLSSGLANAVNSGIRNALSDVLSNIF